MPTALQKRKLMGEINVVPYIDVMLVLLVIFMVTAPLLTQGIEVELPKANAEPIETVPDPRPARGQCRRRRQPLHQCRR